MNRFDKVYLIFVLFLSGALFVSSRYVIESIDTQRAVAVVSYFDKEIERIDMKNEGFHSVRGALGEVIIEIKEGRIRVADEISPKNYCQIQGWISHTNTPIICLPNGIKIELINNVYTDTDVNVK
jgi:hypothetical protein